MHPTRKTNPKTGNRGDREPMTRRIPDNKLNDIVVSKLSLVADLSNLTQMKNEA
jgi:hypothetical protein